MVAPTIYLRHPLLAKDVVLNTPDNEIQFNPVSGHVEDQQGNAVSSPASDDQGTNDGPLIPGLPGTQTPGSDSQSFGKPSTLDYLKFIGGMALGGSAGLQDPSASYAAYAAAMLQAQREKLSRSPQQHALAQQMGQQLFSNMHPPSQPTPVMNLMGGPNGQPSTAIQSSMGGDFAQNKQHLMDRFNRLTAQLQGIPSGGTYG